MCSLAGIGAEPVHFIKMDVQGWEWEALQGMQRTLERSPELVIFFEFWPAGLRRAGADPVAVLRWLESLGFTLRHPVKADEHPIADAAE